MLWLQHRLGSVGKVFAVLWVCRGTEALSIRKGLGRACQELNFPWFSIWELLNSIPCHSPFGHWETQTSSSENPASFCWVYVLKLPLGFIRFCLSSSFAWFWKLTLSQAVKLFVFFLIQLISPWTLSEFIIKAFTCCPCQLVFLNFIVCSNIPGLTVLQVKFCKAVKCGSNELCCSVHTLPLFL